MLENISSMFDDMKSMMKRLKKKSYQENTERFRKEYGHYFQEMTDYLEAREDKGVALKELAVCFVSEVEQKYAKGKKNKIPAYIQVDLNFFMIYYVFPAILNLQHEQSKALADAICSEWGTHFQDSKIGYTDYDTLYNGFRDKIFGLFKIG